jgi:hypothetical protein
METVVLYILGFIIIMTLILWRMPVNKIKVIGAFFGTVLPKIPLAGMLKAYIEAKDNKKGN